MGRDSQRAFYGVSYTCPDNGTDFQTINRRNRLDIQNGIKNENEGGYYWGDNDDEDGIESRKKKAETAKNRRMNFTAYKRLDRETTDDDDLGRGRRRGSSRRSNDISDVIIDDQRTFELFLLACEVSEIEVVAHYHNIKHDVTNKKFEVNILFVSGHCVNFGSVKKTMISFCMEDILFRRESDENSNLLVGKVFHPKYDTFVSPYNACERSTLDDGFKCKELKEFIMSDWCLNLLDKFREDSLLKMFNDLGRKVTRNSGSNVIDILDLYYDERL